MPPRAKFIISAASSSQFPDLKLPEVAVVGRSNVGKSSLINHLTETKKLAHTSSTPGKTRLINFFTCDETFTLVDLPGYGFASVAKSVRETWGDLIRDYLQKSKRLKLILLLSDLRHPMTENDLQFAAWALHFGKPFLLICTKADKLNPGSIEAARKAHSEQLSQVTGATHLDALTYSIKDKQASHHLMRAIKERVLRAEHEK